MYVDSIDIKLAMCHIYGAKNKEYGRRELRRKVRAKTMGKPAGERESCLKGPRHHHTAMTMPSVIL